MKFLVCITQVPDTTTKISFIGGKSLNPAGVQFIINPYDEIALTRALELKETIGGTVTVIHVGTGNSDPIIRKALAIGADDAIRINTEPTDAWVVAFQIAEVIRKSPFDLILTGRESIDYNSGQVTGILAEMLDLPSVCVVTKIDVNGTEVTMEREIDGGKEVITSSLPIVVSAQKGMSEPRIPNMRGIMSARTKPLQVLEAVSETPLTYSAGYDSPPAKQACKMVPADKMDELVRLLHEEAKII
jgi:electron transfer flavoprotein beta subunit